jgi:dolichyl-phosphate-mannose--protein O-mannosyl transferase
MKIFQIIENWYEILLAKWRTFQYKDDVYAAVAVVFIAAILRVPFINYPPRSVYDESLFELYAINTVIGRPFFDPEAPLGWELYSMPAAKLSFKELDSTPISNKINQPFGYFPYVQSRLISALFGILTPLAIYGISRRLRLPPLPSLIPAVMVCFDGVFIVHSRIIMLESIWWAFGTAGLFLTMISADFERRRTKALVLILSGLLFGMAVSVKWLALGFAGAAGVYLFIDKRYKSVLIILLTIPVVYCFVLWSYFGSFYPGSVKEGSLYKSGPGSELIFPGQGKPLENLKLVWDYSVDSFMMHASSSEVLSIPKYTHPLDWPFGRLQKNNAYWLTETYYNPAIQHLADPTIRLTANRASWSVALLALLFSCCAVIYQILKLGRVEKILAWLVIGYAINFVPFVIIDFFADTPLWPFHFMPALLFSFIMIPVVVQKIIPKKWLPLIYNILIFATIIAFFANWRMTYGVGIGVF